MLLHEFVINPSNYDWHAGCAMRNVHETQNMTISPYVNWESIRRQILIQAALCPGTHNSR